MKEEDKNNTLNTDTPVARHDLPLAKIPIQSLIKVIREQQVIMDRDLSTLYGVETRRLNEQVKRNIERFPEDFMFQLTKEEYETFLLSDSNLKSQNATSSWGDTRKLP